MPDLSPSQKRTVAAQALADGAARLAARDRRAAPGPTMSAAADRPAGSWDLPRDPGAADRLAADIRGLTASMPTRGSAIRQPSKAGPRARAQRGAVMGATAASYWADRSPAPTIGTRQPLANVAASYWASRRASGAGA